MQGKIQTNQCKKMIRIRYHCRVQQRNNYQNLLELARFYTVQ